MDLSALIFVSLAVAWAAYLIPKALQHHAEVGGPRSVDRFSNRLRVLARREPVDARSATLVVTPGRPAAEAVPAAKEYVPPTRAELRRRRDAARRATRRRRNVLAFLLLANLAAVGFAASGTTPWWYAAAPAALLLAWLVACRVMVRREHVAWDRLTAPPEPEAAAASASAADGAPVDGQVATEPPVHVPTQRNEQGFDEVAASATTAVIRSQDAGDRSLWDPVPVTLPTYVSKPAAVRRTVRTIDLDSTGVWTSGRTARDSELARAADEAERLTRREKAKAGDRRIG